MSYYTTRVLGVVIIRHGRGDSPRFHLFFAGFSVIDLLQSTLHNSDRFYPDSCIFRTELPSPISFLLKCNTEKVST